MPFVPSATLTSAATERPSLAPTASQPGEAAGEAIVPKRPPVAPSLPAAATSTAPARSTPSAATVSADAPKAANGSASGARITFAWSERLPSPFGSSARSRPASSVAVVPMSAPCCISSTWIGTSEACGATPCRPAGPPRPLTIPAIAVACAAATGSGEAVCGLPVDRVPAGGEVVQVGMRAVDGAVEQRDRDALAVAAAGRERARGLLSAARCRGHGGSAG